MCAQKLTLNNAISTKFQFAAGLCSQSRALVERCYSVYAANTQHMILWRTNVNFTKKSLIIWSIVKVS